MILVYDPAVVTDPDALAASLGLGVLVAGIPPRYADTYAFPAATSWSARRGRASTCSPGPVTPAQIAALPDPGPDPQVAAAELHAAAGGVLRILQTTPIDPVALEANLTLLAAARAIPDPPAEDIAALATFLPLPPRRLPRPRPRRRRSFASSRTTPTSCLPSGRRSTSWPTRSGSCSSADLLAPIVAGSATSLTVRVSGGPASRHLLRRATRALHPRSNPRRGRGRTCSSGRRCAENLPPRRLLVRLRGLERIVVVGDRRQLRSHLRVGLGDAQALERAFQLDASDASSSTRRCPAAR